MSLRINTNIAAANAWRQLSANNLNLQGALGKLSSGYRINRAADDAAGLAVSEKMKAQMRGLSSALRNSQDAVSLVQTAESAAGEIQNMVQRMRELSVQAGSDTLNDTDRTKLDQEFQQLLKEIDRTTDTVTFNGRKLINGKSGDLAEITAGDEITGARVTGALKQEGTYTVSVTQVARQQVQVSKSLMDDGAAATWDPSTSTLDEIFDDGGVGGVLASGDSLTFSQDGKSITVDLNAVKGYTASQFIDHVNTKAEDAGMKMRLKYSADMGGGTDGILIESNIEGTYGDVVVSENIADGTATFGFTDSDGVLTADQTSQDATVTITDNSTGTNLTASTDYTIKGNTITGVSDKKLQGVEFTAAKVGGTDGTLTLSQNALTFQVGANKGETIDASLANLTAKNLAIDSLDITTRSTAETALETLDDALTTISEKRAEMGALQNRLESTISNLSVQEEQLSGANSRIRDVDMAREMAVFTRFQILMQASTAMLAQANQLPQAVLQLIR